MKERPILFSAPMVRALLNCTKSSQPPLRPLPQARNATMSHPEPGTFVRPVGSYGYCLEIVRFVPEDDDGPEQWQCRRWGMDENKQPLRDDHSGMRYLDGLKPVAPGVWKDERESDMPRWMGCPLYYRRIDVGGQMGRAAFRPSSWNEKLYVEVDMGWDGYANNTRGHKAKFKAAAKKVQEKCGTVDFLLEGGALDCSACALALEAATGESAWAEAGWNARKVKRLAVEARWPDEIEEDECWAVESAKAFLNLCAEIGTGIHFSW